jgi:hypothetical protein
MASADYRDGNASAVDFAMDLSGSGQRAAPTNCEQQVHSASDEIVDDCTNIMSPARNAQEASSLLVDPAHRVRTERHRLEAASGV